MDSILPVASPRSRKSESVLLQALASVGQRSVAEACRVDIATISRMDWQRIAVAMTALGLKPVPVNSKCVTPERAQAIEEEMERLRYFARRGLGEPTQPLPTDPDTGLSWGDR